VTCLYSLPELSTFYNRSVEPFVVPILLPLTQMALTGRRQLSHTVYRWRSQVADSFLIYRWHSQVEDSFLIYRWRSQVEDSFLIYRWRSQVEDSFLIYRWRSQVEVEDSFIIYRWRSQVEDSFLIYRWQLKYSFSIQMAFKGKRHRVPTPPPFLYAREGR
jgi:hypothetical protein